MAGTMIPLPDAQKVVADINALNPPITWSEQAKVAYATTESSDPQGSGGERDYYAVWPTSLFSQNCKNVADSQKGYPQAWPDQIRASWTDYQAHKPAAPLPEGISWTYVE